MLWKFLDKIIPQTKADDSDESDEAPVKKTPSPQASTKEEYKNKDSMNSYPSLTSI